MRTGMRKQAEGVVLAISLFLVFCVSTGKAQTELGDAEPYYNRGIAYSDKGQKGQHDQAISDYTKALEINPRYAGAYNNRGIAYYFKREYEKSWKDVEKAQSLGYQIHPKFLDELRKSSGRQN